MVTLYSSSKGLSDSSAQESGPVLGFILVDFVLDKYMNNSNKKQVQINST